MQLKSSIASLAWLLAMAAGVMSPLMASPAAAAGNPTAGRRIFRTRCMICHSPLPDRNMIGPSLFGVVGRKSATAPSFHFSPALKALNVTWNAATLDPWLANPRGMVKGTKMSFAGLKDPQQRADVIAYLATLK